MQWLILEGVKPFDGRYELDLQTNRATTVEWGWIKRFSGYLPANADEGFEGNDPELFAALAVIALVRADKIQPRDVRAVFDVIAAAPVGDTITFDNDTPDDAGVDAGPPAARSNGNEPSSGPGSTTSSETSTSDPSSTGTPASVSSESAQPTSGT